MGKYVKILFLVLFNSASVAAQNPVQLSGTVINDRDALVRDVGRISPDKRLIFGATIRDNTIDVIDASSMKKSATHISISGFSFKDMDVSGQSLLAVAGGGVISVIRYYVDGIPGRNYPPEDSRFALRKFDYEIVHKKDQLGVACTAIHPNGKLVGFGGQHNFTEDYHRGRIDIYDTDNFSLVKSLDISQAYIMDMDYTKDGKYLVGLDGLGKMHIWSAETYEHKVVTLNLSYGAYLKCMDNDKILVVGTSKSLSFHGMVYSLNSSKTVANLAFPAKARIDAFEMSPDGDYLAIIHNKNVLGDTISIIDLASGKIIATKTNERSQGNFYSLVFMHENTLLINDSGQTAVLTMATQN